VVSTCIISFFYISLILIILCINYLIITPLFFGMTKLPTTLFVSRSHYFPFQCCVCKTSLNHLRLSHMPHNMLSAQCLNREEILILTIQNLFHRLRETIAPMTRNSTALCRLSSNGDIICCERRIFSIQTIIHWFLLIQNQRSIKKGIWNGYTTFNDFICWFTTRNAPLTKWSIFLVGHPL